MTGENKRFALYWAPPEESPLGRFGSGWLGRNAAGCPAGPRPELVGWSVVELEQIVTTPRRYGFHATLKPPFRLAAGQEPDDLENAVAEMAASLQPVELPGFDIAPLGRFIALRPCEDTAALNALAHDCVQGIDRFRATPGDTELAKRRAAGLSERQDRYLRRWGYPYLFEEFRFHLTLTGPMEAGPQARLAAGLNEIAGQALGPAQLGDLSLFVEPEPGARLLLKRRFPLGGEAGRA